MKKDILKILGHRHFIPIALPIAVTAATIGLWPSIRGAAAGMADAALFVAVLIVGMILWSATIRLKAWNLRRRCLSQRWVSELLRRRGYATDIDKEGDVVFTINRIKYILQLRKHYFELYVGFGRKRSAVSDELMMRTAQEVMASIRMVKIPLRGEAVFYSIESLQIRREEFAALFDSYIHLLDCAVAEHTRRYNDAIEEFHHRLRRQREEEELSRRYAHYAGKEIIN